MSGFVNTLISMLETPFVGYIAAVVAGILASMSPCVISTIPIAIGYVGGYGAGDTKKTVLCATAFVLGQTVAFVSLGFLFGLMGSILASPWWRVFLALVIIVMGLNVVGLIHIPLPAVDPKVSRNSGIIGRISHWNPDGHCVNSVFNSGFGGHISIGSKCRQRCTFHRVNGVLFVGSVCIYNGSCHSGGKTAQHVGEIRVGQGRTDTHEMPWCTAYSLWWIHDLRCDKILVVIL